MSDDLRPDERYATLKKISSDLPASMFDKFVENLQTRFAAHAKQAKILAASCPKLLSSDSYSEFVKAIAKQEAETIKPEEEEEEEKRPVRVAEMMEEAVRHVYKLVIDRLEQVRRCRQVAPLPIGTAASLSLPSYHQPVRPRKRQPRRERKGELGSLSCSIPSRRWPFRGHLSPTGQGCARFTFHFAAHTPAFITDERWLAS